MTVGTQEKQQWRWAIALSVIPGLGQVYNRQPARGAVLFLGAAGSVFVSVKLLAWSIGTGPTVFNRYGLWFLLLALITIVVFLAGFIFGLYVWASAVVDAYSCARARGLGDAEEATLWHGFHL
jgi:arabinogalactan oligomer / maltooligosaccharide transport system permease protein